MALNINGTTGISGVDGSVSAPALTGTDSNTGITFPSADTIKFATGGVERMAITNSGISGITQGKVLQTVFAEYGTVTTNTTTSYANTGLTASITPSSSSSKIQVLVTQPYRIGRGSASDASGAIQIYRSVSGSETSITSNQGYLLYFDAAGLGTSHGVYYYNVYSVSYQDSPNTTSAVTYLTKARTYSSNTDIKTQYNGAAHITLMEIAA